MRRGLLFTGSALIVAAAGMLGCTDGPTGGGQLVPTGGPNLEVFDPPVEVNVLQRLTPLARDYTASATIDRGGGTISIPEAGFSIDFPANSIAGGRKTLITVTALAGSNVAYVFGPEGLVFHNNPMITQDLKGTEVFQNPALRDALEGAYFPDVTYLGNGTARIKETRPTVVDVNGWRMKFNIHHFSGYLSSTGFRGGYISSSGNRVPTFDR
ncbi:MAG TPA: hypothetical protein VF746_09250 [Longimicrobium sp.]|jgi:hypothetical protein